VLPIQKKSSNVRDQAADQWALLVFYAFAGVGVWGCAVLSI
jgi:hypothetical protein